MVLLSFVPRLIPIHKKGFSLVLCIWMYFDVCLSVVTLSVVCPKAAKVKAWNPISIRASELVTYVAASFEAEDPIRRWKSTWPSQDRRCC